MPCSALLLRRSRSCIIPGDRARDNHHAIRTQARWFNKIQQKNMSEPYHPPFAITSAMLHFVAEIGEWIGRYTITASAQLTPQLRRSNRIRTIQASLAIENNAGIDRSLGRFSQKMQSLSPGFLGGLGVFARNMLDRNDDQRQNAKETPRDPSRLQPVRGILQAPCGHGHQEHSLGATHQL